MSNSIYGTYLTEGNDNELSAKKCLEMSETLMCHMLKYQFQPQHQSSSWVGTILNYSNLIYKLLRNRSVNKPISKNVMKYITDNDMDYQYEIAVSQAITETKLHRNVFPPNRPPEFNILNLQDSKFITNFLIKYLNTNEARECLIRKGIINKER